MKSKITIWLEKGKPTRVRTTKTEEFCLEDLTKVFEELNRKEKGACNGGGQTKTCPKKNKPSD